MAQLLGKFSVSYNCCYSRLHSQLANTYGAECTTGTVLISTVKGSEGPHPMRRACWRVSQIWSVLRLMAPARRTSDPPVADPVCSRGVLLSVLASFLQREISTSLAGVFAGGLPRSNQVKPTCLTARTEDKVPFPTRSISLLSL